MHIQMIVSDAIHYLQLKEEVIFLDINHLVRIDVDKVKDMYIRFIIRTENINYSRLPRIIKDNRLFFTLFALALTATPDVR